MELIDSRRLTGANAVSGTPGAVIDVGVNDERLDELIGNWRLHIRALLDAVGWHKERTAVRRCEGGASLAISAPVDALYAATEINEWAWAAATDTQTESLDSATQRFGNDIAREKNDALLNLAAAAQQHELIFLSDDDYASIGLGHGSQTWEVGLLPSPDAVDWQVLHNIPVALVTGTNGKTTTVRLAAAIARAAGLHVGFSTTDQINVDSEIIDYGDYAGPEGARTVLRNQLVDIALLETARGGLLRRGIGVPHAQAALITRIARDHIGDFGSRNLDELLDAKWVVTRALDANGRLVLNADDARLVARATQSPAPVVYFSLDSTNPVVAKHIAHDGEAWVLHEDCLCVARAGRWHRVVTADSIPVTLGGAALYNVSNALGAAALMAGLGVGDQAIAGGLQSLQANDNRGRGNLFDIGSVKVLIDFAHNPDAFRAIVQLAMKLEKNRCLIAFGEAGDRTDTLIRDLARTAWLLKPDRVITLEIEKYARGRAPGEIRDLLHEQFLRDGAGKKQLTHHKTEIAALDDALQWAEPGDLIILLSLAEQDAILKHVETLTDRP